MKKILCLFLFLPALLFAQPYLKTFPTPIRKVPVTDSAGLTKALSEAVAGDLIELGAGTYNGVFQVTKPGTAQNSIVIAPAAGLAIRVSGGFKITGAHNYVMGLEITGGANIGIEMACDKCGAINNVIHDMVGWQGIAAWNNGSQVIYGNIIWTQKPNNNNPHNIYTQNDYDKYGYKYFISNVVLDSSAATGSTFNFHAYTEGGLVSGMWLERNVFGNGRVLIGGWNLPHHHEVVDRNYFHNAGMQFGYKRSLVFQFLNNYMARSGLRTDYLAGDGEPDPKLSDPSEIKNNRFFYASKALAITTFTTGGTQGKAKLRVIDSSDNNEFLPNFTGSLNANASFAASVTSLTDWRNYTTARGGTNWDKNSAVTTTAPATEHFFIPNEYDPSRGFLVIYNWSNQASLTFARAGAFDVYKIKDTFGTPVVSGTDTVDVPLSGEFEVFLVKDKAQPACDLEKLMEINIEIQKLNLQINELLIEQRKMLDLCNPMK